MKIVGPRAKIDLALKKNGEKLLVEVSRDELDALGLHIGDLVVVDVKNARVFLGDFAI